MAAMLCPRCGRENRSEALFCDQCVTRFAADAVSRLGSPQSYTPKHLAERILTSRSALEGERKQVTILFADLKGSMELLEDRDPEEARMILDPVLEHMVEAVHRFEGFVNQVMGDGIMALFGAPLAHEDHAIRACYAALRMQDSVKRYAEDADGHGRVVAIVGEAGVGKSRLVYEFNHSQRRQNWLVLDSAAVSYGKATSYLPVLELLRRYFKIDARDDVRAIREKVTGKVLTLARTLEPTLPALLALLDVPVDEPTWSALDPVERRRLTLAAVKTLWFEEARERPLLLIVEDLHWVDGETQALLDDLVDGLGSTRLLLLVNYP